MPGSFSLLLSPTTIYLVLLQTDCAIAAGLGIHLAAVDVLSIDRRVS